MAQDLVTGSDATPASASSNVSPGNNGLPALDLSLDAMASGLSERGQEVQFYHQEAVTAETPAPTEPTLEEPAQEAMVEELADASDEPIVEAEPTADIDEQSEGVPEKFAMSFDELSEQVDSIEINGKDYALTDLKSILGQEVSAGQKAREATDRIKQLEAREAQLIQQENMMKARESSHVNVGELQQIQSAWNALTPQLDKARQEGDVYQMTLLKDRRDMLSNQYSATKSKVDNAATMQSQQQEQIALEGLRKRGLDYLTTDTPQARAWTSYAQAALTSQEMHVATLSPAFAELVEKARKWDTAAGSEGKKLVSKAKTLKAPGKKPPSKTQQDSSLMSKIKSGKASSDEVAAAFNAQGRDMFRPQS